MSWGLPAAMLLVGDFWIDFPGVVKMSAANEESFACFLDSDKGKELASLVVGEKETFVESCTG